MQPCRGRSLASLSLRGRKALRSHQLNSNAFCPRGWQAITVDCYRDLHDAGGEFDIVLASAIVEHIPYPKDILISLFDSLRVGGIIYFRTPAVSSMIRLASSVGARLGFGYPEHVHDMGQAFWENMLPFLGLTHRLSLLRSRPSIVQADCSSHPMRAVAAHILKWPWYIFRSHYTLVGGWELVIGRTA